MSFEINGASGKYDKLIKNDSIKYGMNAVNNHNDAMINPIINSNNMPPILDFSGTEEAFDKNINLMEKYADQNDAYMKSLPPLEYEYRYMPNVVNGNIDKKAVLAAAYEELGQTKEISVEDFENNYLIDKNTQTAEPLDLNKDGKIDIAEYASNIIATDILSKETTDPTKADGVINTKGMNTILTYTRKSNADAAAKLYSNIYNTHNLGSELNEFSL